MTRPRDRQEPISGDGDGAGPTGTAPTIDPVGELAGHERIASRGFPSSGEASVLTDVRAAGHDGFDRVVFELTDAASDLTYELAKVGDVRALSGRSVEVDGDSIIRVILTPASRVDLFDLRPDVVPRGPDRLSPTGATAVKEVVLVSDFEAQLVWAIGVPEDARFAVDLFDGPRRLVIDIG